MIYRKISILLAFFLFSTSLFAQSKTSDEDGWLKRNWSNMIARYNVYFNADRMLNDAVNRLYTSHKDDFEEILTVYPYGDEDAAKNMRAPMEETMKKASKVINQRPHSKWVDDAWFIIGQTYFYQDDQYAAIETFQYLYSKFYDEEMRAKAQLWVMKSYLRQEKYNDAEAILSLIRENKTAIKNLEGEIHLVAGDLYIKQGKYGLAVEELEAGLPLTKNRIIRYRVHFILGQLYLDAKEYAKAGEHFERVVKMNAPYEYVFQANLGMAKATAESGGTGIKATKKSLRRMLNDDKNIEYYDQIYYQLATLEFSQGNEEQGLEYMLRSSAHAQSNPSQQTKTYLFLADYYFNSRQYDKSQSYYDSAVTVLPSDYPEYDKITAKHAVLSKLIDNIETVQIQDSLLKLSMMPREELDKLIMQKIEEKERAERLAKEEEELKAERDRMSNRNRTPGGNMDGGGDGTWYFYNSASVSRGYNDFMRTWGKRSYGDYWKYANKVASQAGTGATPEDPADDPLSYNVDADPDQQKVLEDIDADKRSYYQNIPFSTTAKLVANKKIQASLLEMGEIYYIELKEYAKSIQALEAYLTRYPQAQKRPEGMFYLAKAWLDYGDTNKYDEFALKIANEFPESPYNKVLNSKEVVESGEDIEVLALYERMYSNFNRGNYDSVRTIKVDVDTRFAGNSIQAKFDYLYALMIGQTEGKEAYIEELAAIKDNYPGTDIANIAAYTITTLTEDAMDDKIDMSLYSDDLEGAHYYVITAKTEDAKQIEIDLTEYNERFFPSKTFQIKSLVFGDKTLFYIKSFPDKGEAESYHREMKANFTFLTNLGLEDISTYAITEDNFKTLVKSQEESIYLYFFNKYYPFEL